MNFTNDLHAHDHHQHHPPSISNDNLTTSLPSLSLNGSTDPHAGHRMNDYSRQHEHGPGHGVGSGKEPHTMSFHAGFSETILFHFWQINNVGGLIASCIALFIVAALYECLKFCRERWLLQAQRCTCYKTAQRAVTPPNYVSGGGVDSSLLPCPAYPQQINGSASTPQGDETMGGEQAVMIQNSSAKEPCRKHGNGARYSPFRLSHVFQTLLHMIQLTLAYLLMLVFMTYNVWLCLSVIFGAGAGYFILGHKRRLVDFGADCH